MVRIERPCIASLPPGRGAGCSRLLLQMAATAAATVGGGDPSQHDTMGGVCGPPSFKTDHQGHPAIKRQPPTSCAHRRVPPPVVALKRCTP